MQLIAYLALAGMLPFALLVFGRMHAAAATSIVVIVGSVFLPEEIAYDFPAIPPMDKENVTYLVALVAAWVYQRPRIARARVGAGPEVLLVLLFFANIATAAMNSRPMMDEGRLEDALGLYWIIARTGDDLLQVAVPFFVGRAMFRTPDDLRVLLIYLVAAGVIMTGLILIEVGMSLPFKVWQLSNVLYGVPMRPMWRWGVIQPTVFMDNGLSLASFMACCAISAAGIARARLRPLWMGAKSARNLILSGLFMTWNVAGIVYGFTLSFFCSVLRPRVAGQLGVVLATLGCTYPVLRMADVFPREPLVQLARGFDEKRARSLEGRFEEEDFVLSQIGNRLWLGWGTMPRIPGAETFGRGETGLDGWWTMRVGANGILGFTLHYVFLAIPVFIAWRRLRAIRSAQIAALLAALMVMVGVRMIDLLINGWWNSLPVFLAGALYGVSKTIRAGATSGGGRAGPASHTIPVAS